jgi:hypothetical protein
MAVVTSSKVLVLYRKRPVADRGPTNRLVVRAFSIQRLEGSQFGNWLLWILDTVCAARPVVRRRRGPENRLIADAADGDADEVEAGGAAPDCHTDAPRVYAAGLVVGSR